MATTYPLSTLGVTITSAGISAPAYADIHQSLQASFQSIYGSDAYIDPDSQDGQWIALLALAIHEDNQAAIANFQAFSPSYAQGTHLSSLVKLNGLTRKVASHSTAVGNVVGVAGAVITDGVVEDVVGNLWDLPASVTIPVGGTISVTVTAQQVGSISVGAGDINKVHNPQLGWQSFSNTAGSVPGAPVETDAELRMRQAISVAVPSLTIFEGIVGSIANLTGVTRYKGLENDTDVTDGNGIPSHSIALIVEGGDTTVIATTIAEKKTPGTGTAGAISTTIIDSVGSSHLIKFDRPTAAVIKVALTITQRTGYSAAVLPIIKQAIVDYLNALEIGEKVVYSKLFVPANLNNQGLGATYDITAMTIARDAGAFGTTDITLAYNEVATGVVADVTITGG